MENIVLFGASGSAKNFLRKQDKYHVICLCDNDVNKHGKTIHNLNVVSPLDLKSIKFDKIVIASDYFKEIKSQLIDELGFSEDVVEIPPKNLLKNGERYPFEDEAVLNRAKKALFQLVEILNNNNIGYFITSGTLLGVVREQNLIKWDDDIDMSCFIEDEERIEQALTQHIASLNIGKEDWGYEKKYSYSNKLTHFKIYNLNEKQSYSIDINLIYIEGDNALQLLETVPKYHYENYELLTLDYCQLKVPQDYIAYLELVYGDWKTPKKDMTFENYDSIFDF